MILYTGLCGDVWLDASTNIIWYQPADISKPPQILEAADSLCGVGFFETSAFDPFRDCCGWHDSAYTNRAFWEAKGWDRQLIDLYFYHLMLGVAGEDKLLAIRAREYYTLVRLLGWIFYYKHPGLVNTDHANLFCLAKEQTEELNKVLYGTTEGK